MLTYKFKVIDPIGFHARPAAKIVEAAKVFSTTTVNLHFNDKKVSAKSIISLMSLGIGTGQDVSITFEGEKTQECFDSVKKVIEDEKLGQSL